MSHVAVYLLGTAIGGVFGYFIGWKRGWDFAYSKPLETK